MLVLTRRKEEIIMIGEGSDAIEIEVIRIGPDSVKLGINAPKSQAVHRKEIWDRIQEEKQSP